MTNNNPKIIIAGAGPGGLATALYIAKIAPKLAEDMIILEAKEHPRPKLCGGGVTIHGEEQLEKLGIHIDVPSFAVHQLAFRLGDQEFLVPHQNAMRVIQRSEFDSAIAKAVLEQGITIQSEEKVRDVVETGNGIEVSTDKATYHTKVLVGTDGANSTVRRKLNFASAEGVARLLRTLTPIDPDTDSSWRGQTATFDFSCVLNGIQGYMWDFPCYVDGQLYSNRGIFDSRIAPNIRQEQPHGNLKKTFQEWLQVRNVDLDDTPLRGHPVRWFTPNAEFSRPHVLLGGDAAGVDALFAEGISYAMEYGAIIAGNIQHAFATDDFSFTTYRDQLLSHRVGTLLLRRKRIASALYSYRFPNFWSLFWYLAKFAPRWMQRRIGAYMALLPAQKPTANMGQLALLPLASDITTIKDRT